ncbi:MAG TPA: GNAT family N-acetyltransferase [Myxococcales bacterium]
MGERRIGSAKDLTLTALAELFTEGFRDHVLPMRTSAEQVAARICQEQIDLAASLVLFDGAEPCALALVARRGRVCRLAALGVVPRVRRTGAGRALVAAVVGEAKARGDTRMRLEVFEANRGARALYEQAGFQVVQRLIGYDGPGPRTSPIGRRADDQGVDDRRAAPDRTHDDRGADATLIAGLTELEPTAFAEVLPMLPGLPWQIDRASLAVPPPGARCFAHGAAFAYLSGVMGQVAWVRGIFTAPGERRRGHAQRLVQALSALFAEQRLSIPPLFPEGLAEPFLTKAGFVRAPLTQLELAIHF